jgi:hypothetical protein
VGGWGGRVGRAVKEARLMIQGGETLGTKQTTDRMMTGSKEPGCKIVCDAHAESNANNSLRTHLGAVMKLPVTAADCTPLLSVAVTETL